MQIAGGRDHIVASTETLDDSARLALQCALNERFGRCVVLIGEGNVAERSRWRLRVNQDAIVALNEAAPFVVGGDLLCVFNNVAVQCALLIQLTAHELEEGVQGQLHGLDDVSLECRERVLHCNSIIAAVVLLNDLLVQSMIDTTAQNIRVMLWLDFVVGRRTIRCSMLAKQFDVFLCHAASLVDSLASFARARFELFGFVLDFLVKSFQDG